MFGSGKGSKVRSANHTAKRIESYTKKQVKANIKYKGLQGEVLRKAAKRAQEQIEKPSSSIKKSTSQLKLEKQASEAFRKLREANVDVAKHTIRSKLSSNIASTIAQARISPQYNIKKEIESLTLKANKDLRFKQAKAKSNIATTELSRKASRPSQQGLLPTQSMLQLAKNKSLSNRKMINSQSSLQIQAIKNTLRALPKNSKEKIHAEKRLAYYTIKNLTAKAAKAKANIELERKKARNPTNPKFTESMKRLAKTSSRENTKSQQFQVSMEKHQGRLSGITSFTSANALTSVAEVLKPGTGVAGIAGVLKPLATSVEKVLQRQTNLPTLEIQKQVLQEIKPLTQLETEKSEDIKLLETTDPDTNTSKLLGEKTVVSPLSPNSSSLSLVKTTLNKPFIIQPHKTQLEILKEKEDTTKIHSTELNALLNSFMKGETINTPKNMEEILKASKINNNTISKIKNLDGTITQDKIKLFLSTPETITKLQNYKTQLDTNKSKITENISQIEANTTKLHTIQETHTEYKTIKSEIETKQATINELKARQTLLSNNNTIQKLQQQINNAETEKTRLETKKTELKTKLVEYTKDLTQTLVKSKSLNNQIKQIEQNPDVYYGQMMSKYKTANTTKNEATLKKYILDYGSPAEKEIIKLKNSSNHQKQEKQSMIDTKTQTKVNLEAQIKKLEQQKTKINKEEITKKNIVGPDVVKEAPSLVNQSLVKQEVVEEVTNNNNNSLSPAFTQSLQNKGLVFNANSSLETKAKTEAELAKEENAKSGYMDL